MATDEAMGCDAFYANTMAELKHDHLDMAAKTKIAEYAHIKYDPNIIALLLPPDCLPEPMTAAALNEKEIFSVDCLEENLASCKKALAENIRLEAAVNIKDNFTVE